MYQSIKKYLKIITFFLILECLFLLIPSQNVEANDLPMPTFKTSEIAMNNCNQGSRYQEIIYQGSALTNDTVYYWRIKFWNDEGEESPWSTQEAYFQITATSNMIIDDLKLDGVIVDPNQ